MADALVAGVQYGLSSPNSHQHNSLVFVKLTDSAYRAIEEYLRNGVSADIQSDSETEQCLDRFHDETTCRISSPFVRPTFK